MKTRNQAIACRTVNETFVVNIVSNDGWKYVIRSARITEARETFNPALGGTSS